jgi:inorganic triphosphatase YgiF
MVKEDREVELKLELDTDGAELLRAHALLAPIEPRAAPQSSIYYDTPDGMLRRSGFTLRVRDSKGRHVQTVKQQVDGAAAGLFDRPEWEDGIEGCEPDFDLAAKTPLGPLLTKKVRRALRPLIRSDVSRTVWMVDWHGGTIEVVLDVGDVTGGKAVERIAELELELKNGSAPILLEFARALIDAVPARIGVLTKAERGYRLADGSAARAAKGERIDLSPGMSSGEGFAAICHSCLRQFRLNEPLVVSTSDPSALHQARVAMRRLRSAFVLFRPVVAGDPAFPAIREEVRWFTNQLGDARNLDVLLKRVGDRSKPLCKLLETARDEAYEQVLGALASTRLRHVMLDLVAWIETGAWRRGEPAAEPIEDFASDQLDKRWRKVKKGGRQLAKMEPEARHQLRIEVKKLRYAVEFLAALQTGDAAAGQKKFAAAVEDVQEQLGHLNDAETARELLGDLIGERPDRDALLRAARGDDAQTSEKETIAAAAQAHRALIDIGRFWR